ncbi:MAG: heme exporter protein CcmB [Actinobacteria bacterium]|nr:heme exporter protein CcmB [Actinomycetota bacterium]MBU1494885.1 heme exporter protein CcmB [Actinomycetota bacterium]
MTGFWTQAAEMARKDLRTEVRTGEVFLITIPFGAVALMLIPLAVGTDTPLLRNIGPGMFWVVVLLFGVLVATRQSGVEGTPQQDLLSLLGIDPAAQFTGRAGATTLLLLAFELVLGPVALALYDPQPKGWPWIALLVPLVAAGLGLLGTLAATIASSIASSALVPLLVAPLSVPILLAATQTMDGLRYGNTILGWILLLVTMDLLLAVAGVLSARPLQEASR